jgi:hypothetical protein
MQKFTVDHSGKVAREAIQSTAFLITPKTAHTGEPFGIMMGVPKKGEHPVLAAIDAALKVSSRREYEALESDFSSKTSDLQKRELFYDGSRLERYAQVVFRIVDDTGNCLDDYAIELIDGDRRGDRFPSGFLGHQHKNEVTPERFVFYLNTELISKAKGGKIGFRVHAATGTPLVDYPVFEYLGAASDVAMFLKPNQTTLVEVVLRRRLNKNVFRLSKRLSYQKIDGKPSKDWIN